MKKVLSIIGIVILVVVIGVVLFLGQIIKGAIETVGPQVAGVPMSVEKVRVNPLTGLVHVKALVIGNPDGFNTPSAMELGEFKLDISLGSLFTDTVVIKQILIDGPQITYEKSLKSSNLAELQKNLAPAEAAPKEEVAEAEPKEKKSAKKVIIEDFQFTNAKVNVTITALGGKKMTLPLPPIKMQDIGKDTGGASPVDVVKEVFASITSAVGKAVSASVGVAGDALKGAGDLATGLAGDAAGVAGDAAGAATDAAKDAAGAATDAVKDAAGALKKGIGGLFGGDKE